MQDQVGKLIADKYKIEKAIRHSADGGLFQAHHTLMDKPVTLCLLDQRSASDPAAVDTFFESARRSSRLDHQNILKVLDFGTDQNGDVYAVYDAADPETLRTVIRDQAPLPAENAIEIGRQIALGLGSAHAAEVIHGNLTTDNVILADSGNGSYSARLTDFGSADPIARSEDVTESTAGDFAYIAPERCAGTETSDPRGDVYALGVILYEMVAGVAPFTGEKPTDVMLKHIEEPPAPLVAFRQDLPPNVEPVILKALAKDPDLRYQTAADVADALAGLQTPVKTLPAAAVATAASGSFWKSAFIILVGVGLLAAALIYATSVKQTDPQTVLQPDPNGLPVQPINPATGTQEQALAAMPDMLSDSVNDPASLVPSDSMPGGDGYNPWAGGGPPPGAPDYYPPGGQLMTIEPGAGSQFMPPDGCVLQPSGILLCPKPLTPGNANTKPPPSPAPETPANANTVTPSPTKPDPQGTQPAAKPSPKPPAQKPAPAGTPENGASEPGDSGF